MPGNAQDNLEDVPQDDSQDELVQPIFPTPPAQQYELYLQCKAHGEATELRQNFNMGMRKINDRACVPTLL